MARLILKANYHKPNTEKKVGGYAKYIATREGVDKVDESFKLATSSVKQQKLIEKILRDFSDTKDTHEYEDYIREPTLGNAEVARYLFTVEVDGTAPTITLNGIENGGATKDTVTITNPSETATIKVTKDGEEIRYTPGDEITETGLYKVTVTDEVGNTAEYTFTIEKSLGAGAIIGIIFGCMILVGGIVVVILKKKEII